MLIFLLAAALLSQDPEPALDCDKAMTTLDVNACMAKDLATEEAQMERYLEAARTRAAAIDASSVSDWERTQAATYLKNGQTAWEAYAAIVCDGVYDQWKGGTIRNAMYLGCKIEMTRERPRVIWRDYLTYADSTPPILPEPTDPATDAPQTNE